MANDLLIKINADAKNAKKAFDDIRDQTSELESSLATVAKVSAVAFAALTAEIYFSEKAFNEARAASMQLTNALQNQGIYTDELKTKYEEYADAVQAATGIDNDAIIKAQAVAQSYLGQIEITQELTTAIADLGASMGGDLNGAAEKIARTIGTSSNAFAKQGLVISESATEAERMGKVLEFVSLKAGGLAEDFNKADGFTKALATSFGNFQEGIGKNFAPILEAARKVAIGFFDAISKNEFLTQIISSLILAGTVVAGLSTAIAAGIPAFLALSAAATTLGISLSVALVGIPLLIGAIVAGITLLALNWDTAMASIAAAARGAITFLTEAFSGLGNVLKGVFEWDEAKLKKGLGQIGDSFKKAKDETVSTYQEITAAQAVEGEKQDAQKTALAEREASRERQHQANLRGIRQAEIALLKLQNENASAEFIALKQQEIEVLKALDADKSAQELALFRERRDKILAMQVEQQSEDLEKQREFAILQAEVKAEFDAQGIEIDAALREEKLTALRATAQTENDIERQLQEEILAKKIAGRNTELLEKKKYGEAYSKINKAITSEEVQGVKSASSDLVALQQSKNSSLKAIGKAAAVSQIGIATAESAMNIYKGFSTIPIIGPALGVAGAAAAVAFGAERIGNVLGAQDGGLVEGGIAGRDSVPALLEPGELVVPRKNFADVVGSASSTKDESNQEMLNVLNQINEKFSNPRITNINGDVQNDDSYIDALVRKISDSIEFRNAQIVGVTS